MNFEAFKERCKEICRPVMVCGTPVTDENVEHLIDSLNMFAKANGFGHRCQIYYSGYVKIIMVDPDCESLSFHLSEKR